MPEIVDALVIGGGPAGLSAAMNLARYAGFLGSPGTVEGVSAGGDVPSLHSDQVATALHEGTQAAAANQLLYPEELRAP